MTAQIAALGASLDSAALSRLGSALSDVTRCAILARLALAPSYPADLARDLGTTRANISNHLACLRGHGLVTGTPEGRRVCYRLANPALGSALGALVATLQPETAAPR